MTPQRFIPSILLTFVMLSSTSHAEDAAAKLDPRYPFRTDSANSNLRWYEPVPGEFPPHHSDHRVSGELVSADFIHRRGQFRMSKTGELVDFTMPPYGTVNYLNTDAELRDVPLGTFFLFFLNQDANGNFTRLATMQDQYTMDAGHAFSYRADELKLTDGKLLVTKQSVEKKQPDLGKKELIVNEATRVWRGTKQVKLTDIAPGDALLYNLTAKTATNPGRCTDVWIGDETHRLITEKQRKNHAAFVKVRGLPGWIDADQGNKLTVTLFSGDPATFSATYLANFAVGKEIRVVVANDELRTWNPPVDGEKSKLIEIRKGSVDRYGTSGVQLVLTVPNMLEGFRKGRIVRIFEPGWQAKDQFYGESLMNYGYARLKTAELMELTPREYPTQFPFRTDYGNELLPWYQLQPGVTPPPFSGHLVFGELVKVDSGGGSGTFRTDRTGEMVDFTCVAAGGIASVKYLNADANLSDMPLGTRCRFNLYQDGKAAFTRAMLVTDEFSYLADNAITCRIETIDSIEGKMHVARQIPEVKNYNGDMEQPPDIGRTELHVIADTRIWKGERQLKLTDLAVGDLLLVNVTSEQPGSPSHCTVIWAGVETQQHATDQQTRKHAIVKGKG